MSKLINSKANKLEVKNYSFGFNNFLSASLYGTIIASAIYIIAVLIAYFFFQVPVEVMGLKSEFLKPLFNLCATLIIIGVWEEFVARGLVFNTLLKNDFGFHLSALISSVFFSLIHWSSFDMNQTSYYWYFGIVFIGYIFCYVYVLYNSIWAPVFFHFAWNFFSALSDPSENKIGLFELTNWISDEKRLDNVIVVVLAVVLIFFIYFTRKGRGLDKVKFYENQLKGTS